MKAGGAGLCGHAPVLQELNNDYTQKQKEYL
jgi:predicted double-glycine peptidase